MSPRNSRPRPSLPALARRVALGATIFGALGFGAVACHNDVDITDPNAASTGNFFKTEADAQAGVVAIYNTLNFLGNFGRWQAFSYDMRSDEGTSASPWAELQAFVKFRFPSGYDFDVNRDTWNDTYTLISRANAVIANVPAINMNEATKTRLLGEAKFLRGLGYFHLVTLFGAKIPLITAPVTVSDRPAASDSTAMWAQIEKDFTEAAAALPVVPAQTGRASKGAAQGMLAKVLLQEKKWAAASTALDPVINKQVGNFGLDSNYASLFTNAGNNRSETLFEVQMGNPALASSQGLFGLNIAKMVGPCGPSYCDGRPTQWFVDQFRVDPTTTGGVDPRLDATIFYYQGPNTPVYAQTWAQRYGNDTTTKFFKKYGEYYTGSPDQSWEAEINYKVLRYSDILLMKAEALNESGSPAAAAPLVNLVRDRVHVVRVATTLNQSAMRAVILKERLLEFGLEGQRWLDLGRQNLFADLTTLKSHDADFNSFEAGKSVVLPITQAERNLNPGLAQNPGY
jgi:starch-binding outer membrane protein, SusD/RagB family